MAPGFVQVHDWSKRNIRDLQNVLPGLHRVIIEIRQPNRVGIGTNSKGRGRGIKADRNHGGDTFGIQRAAGGGGREPGRAHAQRPAKRQRGTLVRTRIWLDGE